MPSHLNKRTVLTLLAFVTLGLLIYSNTLKASFYFDDAPNIVRNPYFRLIKEPNLKNLAWAAFNSPCSNRPIANISFALTYYFHKENVIGFHAINIIIHILAGILLYFFIRTTLNIPSLRSRYKHNSSIAFFAALFWLVHPIQTQSVTYIVQRMNGMAAMFYVLSFLLYVKGRLVKQDQRSWPWFAGCALAGILALGSKEIAATLPFFIFLYEWYFFQDLSKAWLRRCFPYVIGTFIFLGLLVFFYIGSNPLDYISSGYKHRDFTLTQRVLTQFRVVVCYISLMAYPHPGRLNLDHDFSLSNSLFDPITTSLSLGVIVALIALAFLIAKKERLASFCIFWFFGNLAIESSVIPLEIMFEHRVYLPSMFFFLLTVALAHRFIKQDWAVVGALTAVTVLFCLWTYQRNSVWGDPTIFWADVVKKSPRRARAYNYLGVAYGKRNNFATAMRNFEIALEIDPEFSDAHSNLGVALARHGQFDEAIAHYTEALRIKPGFANVHNNLAIALAQQGNLEQAMAHYARALRVKPDFAEAHYNLANLLVKKGKIEEAVEHYHQALRTRPGFARARHDLKTALQKARKDDRPRSKAVK